MFEDLKRQLTDIPQTSGIYQFFDEKDNILYVGKAKNLRKRVTSYSKEKQLSGRIFRMVSLSKKIEFIQTNSEVEALLLEHNLIKKLEPRYNILLRDDKTFPQIVISDHEFPKIAKYRNHATYSKNKKAKTPKKTKVKKLFGPFASGHDVNRVIEILKKAFLIRGCSDTEFKSRKRPCLEYQIKKCSAPCTNEITAPEYDIAIGQAIDFLNGKSDKIQKDLKGKMIEFSEKENYEKAAQLRDQIKSLDSIQEKQDINLKENKNIDVIALSKMNDRICIYVSFYRGGQNFGSKPYFFKFNNEDLDKFLNDFLGQFYLSNQSWPNEIWLSLEIAQKNLMEEFLGNLSEQKIKIINPKKGDKLNLIKNLEEISRQNLERQIADKATIRSLLLELKNLFNLEKIPQKIEVYDNSHTGGKNAVGALITAGIDGFIKSKYRKFNIKFDLSQNHDDTAMLEEVLTRRFSKLDKKEYPDFIIIDGGKGQLTAVKKVFDALKVKIPFICMSKGENRNAGEEWFHQIGQESKTLPKHSPLMHYLQRLRDEAHRFAITSHRNRRGKSAFD